MVTSLGAEVLALSPEQHDTLVAVVSHVPHLTAATLMNLADRAAEEHGALLRLAAGGFRDMTRIAAGQPGIWPDVCAENAPAIVATLDTLLADLSAHARPGGRGRQGGPAGRARARRARPGAPCPPRAVRPERLAELRVPVPDRPGVLAEITTLAGDLGRQHLRPRDRPQRRGRPGRARPGRRRRRRPSASHDGLTGRGYRSTVGQLE